MQITGASASLVLPSSDFSSSVLCRRRAGLDPALAPGTPARPTVIWRSLLLAASLLCMSSTLASAQDGRVVFVLDGSNSMWGRVGDVEKIVVARQVLTDVLADVPPGLDVGLAAYGHRRAGACDDIETLLAPGRHPRVDVERAIRGVQPTGMTPITAALPGGRRGVATSHRRDARGAGQRRQGDLRRRPVRARADAA